MPSAFSLPIPQMIFSFLKLFIYLFLTGASLLYSAVSFCCTVQIRSLCAHISPPPRSFLPTPPRRIPALPWDPCILNPLSSFPVSRRGNTSWKLNFAPVSPSSDFLWDLVLSVKTLPVAFSACLPSAVLSLQPSNVVRFPGA